MTDGKEYFCEKHNSYNRSCSVSFSSLSHMQLNVPEPVEPRDNTIFPDSDEDYPTENNLNQTDFSHTRPIVIDSDHVKYGKYNETDSANHSFDDGIDVIDGIIHPSTIHNQVNSSDYDMPEKAQKKLQANSVDSGISNNINGTNVSHVNNVNHVSNVNHFSNVNHISNVNHVNNSIEINGNDNCQTELINSDIEKEKTKGLPSRLSDLSLKDNDKILNRDLSSDDDKFEIDQDVSPRIRCPNGTEKKNGISLNLKLQSEMR